jgi:hypothetical protein
MTATDYRTVMTQTARVTVRVCVSRPEHTAQLEMIAAPASAEENVEPINAGNLIFMCLAYPEGRL